MAANNNQLFDAALAGFMSGALNSFITDPTQADYAGLVDAATAFATEVDAAIPVDGTVVTPVDSTTLAKVNVLTSICSAVLAGRVPTSTVPSSYSVVAAAIKAAYNETVTSLLLP
jgi:hypothetical protein